MKKYISFGLVFILIIYIIPLSTLITKKEKKIFKGETIAVFDADTEDVFSVPLEEYVLKVLSKEMPASFEKEALKAQAVAIRTYTLKKKQTKNEKHPKATVCTDSNHCMAYLKEEINKEYREKLESAVRETEGQVLMFENEYASTVFHAISSGRTENSQDIWGGQVPYLVSVESTEDKNVKDYETKVTVSY
ncbi:MAG: SpoIID/LytB domain-containing protein, partial [Clostridia bacterium]|nr:SpoIID/LytB domain-containing protein [Clostridia bacterium]